MHKLIWIALVAAFLAFAGCGGDNDEDAPTKAAFIKQADAICTSADQKQQAALEKAAKDKPLAELNYSEQLTLAVELGLPPIEEQAEEIGELTPPDGDDDAIEAIIQKMEAGVEKAEDNPKLLNSGAGPFEEADKLAKQYGFKACAESS